MQCKVCFLLLRAYLGWQFIPVVQNGHIIGIPFLWQYRDIMCRNVLSDKGLKCLLKWLYTVIFKMQPLFFLNSLFQSTKEIIHSFGVRKFNFIVDTKIDRFVSAKHLWIKVCSRLCGEAICTLKDFASVNFPSLYPHFEGIHCS